MASSQPPNFDARSGKSFVVRKYRPSFRAPTPVHATCHLSSMSCSMILSLPLISSPMPSNHARDNRCPSIRLESWPLWIRQHLAGGIHRHFLVPSICVLPSFLREVIGAKKGRVVVFKRFRQLLPTRSLPEFLDLGLENFNFHCRNN